MLDCKLHIKGVDDASHVAGFAFHDALSSVGALEVDLVFRGSQDVETWSGREATFEARFHGDGRPIERHVRGFVCSAHQIIRAIEGCFVRVQLAPMLATLGFDHGSRVFVDQTASQVARTLLDEAGLTHIEVEVHASVPLARHPQLVQRNETALEMLLRTLAADGLHVLTESDAQKSRVVITDAPEEARGKRDPLLLRLVEDRAPGPGVARFRSHTRRAEVAGVTFHDGEPRKSLELRASQAGCDGYGRLVEDRLRHGARDRSAAQALERLRAEGEALSLDTCCLDLAPGVVMKLEGAALLTSTERWLVVAVWHRSTVGGYANQARLVPASRKHAPAARIDRLWPGPTVAVIAGPSGAELCSDEIGSVNLSCAWNRTRTGDDTETIPARMAQGLSSGSMMQPRVGHEVLVTSETKGFEDALVLGTLYGGKRAYPYPHSGRKTLTELGAPTTGGLSELTRVLFDDERDKERVDLTSAGDVAVRVVGDELRTIGGVERIDIGGNTEATVVGAVVREVRKDAVHEVGASMTRVVGVDFDRRVGKSQDLKVGGSRNTRIAGDLYDEVSSHVSCRIDGDRKYILSERCATQVEGRVEHVVHANVSEVVGGQRANITGRDVRDETRGNTKLRVACLDVLVGRDLSERCDSCVQEVSGDQVVRVGGTHHEQAGQAFELAGAALSFSAARKITCKVGKSSIVLEASGEVTLKSGRVRIANAGSLTQLMHKSN